MKLNNVDLIRRNSERKVPWKDSASVYKIFC